MSRFLATGFAVGLLSFGGVPNSAHDLMTPHRDVVLVTLGALIIAAIWRWPRPASKAAAAYSALASLGLL